MDILERLNPFTATPQDISDAYNEIERLRGERWNALKELEKEVLASRSEIERLREALQKIGEGDTCVSLMTHPPICKRAYDARSALSQKENEARILATNIYEAEGRN